MSNESKLIVGNNTIAAVALQIAIEQLGQRETPGKNNSGPMVDKYLKSVGLNPGYAWCQAFVFWCYEQAAKKLGVPNPVVKTAGVLACWNQTMGGFKLNRTACIGNPDIIKPGYQFIMDFGGGKGHTGIVESVDGFILNTIEGNSNNDGSREGVEVVRHQRNLKGALMKGIIIYQ